MQHTFSNKETVDAIVRVGEYIIPIDAKFSLDNYNKMIESENKEELVDLEKNSNQILRIELMKQQNISDLTKEQQIMHICLSLLMDYTKIY
ncbi:MAG: hypothetical protein CM15mP36_12560 [Flavobacteriales bacterium]|nr:MAG: hypothetical protein CM15mP36_12560 [Flavobacteriales bacterium]